MKKTFLNILHLIAFGCAAILFFLASNKPLYDFKEVTSITWNNDQGCSIHKAVNALETICVSSTFKATTNNLELPIKSDQTVTLRAETPDHLWHEDIKITPTIINNKDRGYFFDSRVILQSLPSMPIRISIIANDGSFTNFEAQDRISFFQNISPESIKHNSSNFYRFFAVFTLALTLILIAAHFPAVLKNNATFLFALCLTGLVIHYRNNLFYNWDEWVILDRFLDNGFSEALRRHNEHFMPFYFWIYFFEISSFLKFYDGLILISLVILVINSWLVAKILSLLSPFPNLPATIYKALAFLYLFNSLHHEGMQWAIVQCTFLSHTFSLISVISIISYWRNNKTIYALISALMIPLAAFTYGNGLSTIGFSFLVFTYLAVIEKRFNSRQAAIFALSIIGATAITAIIYLTHSEGTGHTTLSFSKNGLGITSVIQKVATYLLVECQFGGILRGLGLFPSLWPNTAVELLKNQLTLRYFPEVVFAGLGSLVSLSFLVLYLSFKKYRKEYLMLWLLGQFWLTTALILPALARWHFVYQQALSARYQHAALLGLFILLLPLVHIFYQNWSNNKIKAFAIFLALFYLSSNFYMVSSFDYYTKLGQTNLAFIQKLNSVKNPVECLATPKPIDCPNTPQNFDGGLRLNQIIRMLSYLKTI